MTGQDVLDAFQETYDFVDMDKLRADMPVQYNWALTARVKPETFFEDIDYCERHPGGDSLEETMVGLEWFYRRCILVLATQQRVVEQCHQPLPGKPALSTNIMETCRKLSLAHEKSRAKTAPPFSTAFIDAHLPSILLPHLHAWVAYSGRFPEEMRNRAELIRLQEVYAHTAERGTLFASDIKYIFQTVADLPKTGHAGCMAVCTALLWDQFPPREQANAVQIEVAKVALGAKTAEQLILQQCPRLHHVWPVISALRMSYEDVYTTYLGNAAVGQGAEHGHVTLPPLQEDCDA